MLVDDLILRESKLTLDSAVDMCRTSERTTCQLKKLQGQGETINNIAQVNNAARGKKIQSNRKKINTDTKIPKQCRFQM